ncbi:biopolymer transporter ExbD [Aeoliella sp. ICT_H6.2]|uniref:Biopolymer transporter ExbD n=1 Tax=Aeoliella straminimaris TaxID=2954799 RepID=A0A9X2JHR6_9BACT|nr:biopolymer transporter ExbD [Aeoliella straminimaris]MCO6045732.1 biopolymer transporter ExbD [Aeoliella straminimaris]
MTSARYRKPISMNMTPMIDVVFLLIIFFLVSSHLAQQETQLELDLPLASTGDELTETKTERVTINLKADGTVLLGAGATTIDQLDTRLAYEHDRATLPIEVRIRADSTIPFGEVKPVLVACAKAGIWDVSFAVVEEGQ